MNEIFSLFISLLSVVPGNWQMVGPEKCMQHVVKTVCITTQQAAGSNSRASTVMTFQLKQLK